jgi:hypothetical protein
MIVFAPNQDTGLFKVSASGGTAQQLTELDSVRRERTHRWPVFLPDAEHFLFFVRVASGGENEHNAIALGSLDGKTKTLIPGIRSNIAFANDHILYTRENTLMAQPFDIGSLSLSGDDFPVAENIQYSNVFSSGVFTVSKNGKLIYQSGEANTGESLMIVNRNGDQQKIIGQPDVFREVSFSPDAKKLVMSIYDVSSRQIDIWIHDLERDVRTRFTFDDADDRRPVWSPDGTKILFASMRSGISDLYIKSASGAGKESLFFKSEINKGASDWSADGRMISMTESDPVTSWDLKMLTVGQTGSKYSVEESSFQETEFREFSGVFSPDANWLAYHSNESGQAEVYVQPVSGSGGKWQISKNGGYVIAWKKDGSEIYLQSYDDKVMAAQVKLGNGVFEVGAVHTLFEVPGSGDGDLEDVSNDGKLFLVSVPLSERSNDPFTLVTSWNLSLKK